MVIETDLPPFFQWLLGPGWEQGSFLDWLPLGVTLLVVAAGLTCWGYWLRKGSQRAATITARLLALGVLLGMSSLLGLWFADPQRFGLFGSSWITQLVDALRGPLGNTWYLGALYWWLFLTASLASLALVVGWLVWAVRRGPLTAFRAIDRLLSEAVFDLAMTSPRRLLALSWLSIKESIRRRVVVVFELFVLILLFGAWYIDPTSDHPARLYLTIVVGWIPFLVVLMAGLFSSLSLPMDISNKTLHTVVTKPVRAGEIVLGRILGFTAVGTVMLVVMAAASYIFVVRGLAHTHKLPEADWKAAIEAARDGNPVTVLTSRVHGHRHRVEVGPEGPREIQPEQDHIHQLRRVELEGKVSYVLGLPRGGLVARVPLYGKLRFKNRRGEEVDKGINVGDEWTYRSFIEGDSLAAAIWTFEGITEENFPADDEQFAAGIPLEMTLEVFRTTKGKTDDPSRIPGTLGSLSVRPTTAEIIRGQAELDQRQQELERIELTSQARKSSRGQPASPPSPELRELRDRYQREIEKMRQHLGELRAALHPPVEVKLFEARDFVTDVHHIPRVIQTPTGETLDLFRDLAPEGRLEVWLRCEEPAQYFGVAQADVYIRSGDAPFWLNLLKGYAGVWLQMLLVIGIGVTFSTLLSGPIAMLATLGTLVGGLFRQFMSELGAGTVHGGGPLEALDRLLTQKNVVSELEPGVRSRVVQMVDDVLEYALAAVAAILPEFGRFSFSRHVAYGFNISGDLLGQCFIQAGAFLLPVFLAGYFFMKTREVAR